MKGERIDIVLHDAGLGATERLKKQRVAVKAGSLQRERKQLETTGGRGNSQRQDFLWGGEARGIHEAGQIRLLQVGN